MRDRVHCIMIESGMSLSHMKTNVTIVSHGRVSLVTRLGPDCQRCKWHGYRTVFGTREHGGVCGCSYYARYGVRFL